MTKLRFLLLLWPSLVFAQTPDTLRAHYHYLRADSLEHAYYHDSAFAHFQRAAGGYYLAGAWGRYVRCLNRQAVCQYRVGRYDASLALAQYALRFSTDSLGKYHAETADAYAGVGDGYYGVDQYDSALVCYQQAIGLVERIFGVESRQTAPLIINFAKVHRLQGHYQRARDYGQRALKLVGKDNRCSRHYWTALDVMGDAYYWQLQLDSAMYYYRKALKSKVDCLGKNHPSLYAQYCGIGAVYQEEDKYRLAESFFHKALRVIEPTGNHNSLVSVYQNLGGLHHEKHNYDSALHYYEYAHKIRMPNPRAPGVNESFFYANAGLIYRRKGYHGKALQYIQKALAIELSLFGEFHPNVAINYHNLGDSYEKTGAFDLAINYYNKALAIDKEVFGDNHLEVANDYYALGTAHYNKEDYNFALRYLRKATTLYQQFSQPTKIHDNYYLIGLTLARLNKYHEAFQYLNKAIQLVKVSGNPILQSHHLAHYYQGIGDVYHLQERYQKALKHYRLALLYGRDKDDSVKFYAALADTYLGQHEYDSALKNYHQSIQLNILDSDSTSIYTLPPLANHQYQNAPYLLTTLHGKAVALKARYQQRNNPHDLYTAQRHYQVCDSLIVQMRHTYLKHGDRITFGKTAREVYAGALRASLAEEYPSTVASSDNPTEAAFYFAERSKAGALTLALADRRAKYFAGVPDTLLTQEKQLQQERTFYRRQEQEAQRQEDRVRQQHAEDRRFALDRRYDSLVQTMERRFPRYHTLKYGTRVRSLSDVRARLDARTALLEYVLGDTVGYVFGVSQRRDTVLQFAVDSRLHRQLQTLRTTFTPDSLSVVGQAASDYASVAYRVYRRLLAPVLATLPPSVDRLVVVPDGALSYLPFDMLLTEPVRHRRYRQWPYLLRHYALSYAYSATLQWPDARPAPQQSPVEADDSSGLPRLLALAPAYEGVQQDSAAQRTLGEWRDAVVPLAWNQHEVTNLRRYLPGTFVAGDAAQEATFKDQTDGHTVVHLAAHALLDEEDPMQSRLVFSTPTDSTEDGFLHAYELYGMDVPARLAVLSACHTGSGRLAEGEGLMSLARAFAYAGCPSVVMNRWAAHDATTSRVMDRLYYYLAEGYDKADALRQAKLDFLAQARGAAQFPAYWGGWMLVGDRTPLMSPSRGPGWVVLLLLILVGGGVGWWVWAQRRKVMR